MVVYTTDGGGFADVAGQIAADRDESLVTDLDEATTTTEDVVYVEEPSEISEYTLLALQRRLLERTPETGGFSIVTGYTPELAEELYFEEVDQNGEDLLSFMLDPPAGVDDIETGTVLQRDGGTVEALEELTAEPLRSFGINANGRTIHISVGDGYICGAPESQSFEEYSGRQPFCVEDGEVDCPLTDDLVRAESIDAAHVFLLSCSSTVDNATSDLPVLPSLGLLDGADSLIGAYRVAPSWPYELLFHHSLLLSGYDLNERCYLLNKNSHVNGIMGFPYVAYGRPDAAIDEPHAPEFDVEFRPDGEDLRIHLSDVDGYVLDFVVPEASVPGYDERLYVRNRSDTDARVYYLAYEHPEGVRMLLFSGSHLQSDLELEVSSDYAQRTKREIVVDSVENVMRTEETGFLDADWMDRVLELRKEMRNLPKQTETERFDADRHASVDSVVDSLYGQVNSLREDLLSGLRERSDYLIWEYAGSMRDEEVYVSEYTCPTCTERPVFIKQVVGWTGTSRRLLSACPRCGYVFDIPVDERDPAPTYPRVETDLGDPSVSEPTLTMAFENPREVPLQATFVPLALHMDNESTSFFDPDRQNALLAPGESHTAEFDVDADAFPDNMYYVLGIVLANMSVYAGYTVAVVGEKGAYYPGHLR